MADKPVVVSVRLSDATLRQLQLLAQVYQSSAGELIRTAVGKHVEEITRSQDFKTKALELKERNEQTLNELLEVSSLTSSNTTTGRQVLRRNRDELSL